MDNKKSEMMPQEHEVTIMDTKPADVAAGYKKIENAVVSGYQKIEDSVVSGYKKIETGAVNGFNKVVDKCVEVLFAREGECVEDAKKRLSHKEEK